MVDVTGKDATKRIAVAAGTLRTRADVIELIATGGLPKGDALATARVAGILGRQAHQRSDPAVPPAGAHRRRRRLRGRHNRCRDHRDGAHHRPHRRRDGGATAVSVAALTLYDMIKAVDPAAIIDDIRVRAQRGRQDRHLGARAMSACDEQPTMTRTARVIIASTRAAAGVYEDRTRTRHRRLADGRGYRQSLRPVVVADGIGVSRALLRGGRRPRRPDHHLRRHRHLADRRHRRTPPPTSSTTRSPAWPTPSGARVCRTCRRRCCRAACAACGTAR